MYSLVTVCSVTHRLGHVLKYLPAKKRSWGTKCILMVSQWIGQLVVCLPFRVKGKLCWFIVSLFLFIFGIIFFFFSFFLDKGRDKVKRRNKNNLGRCTAWQVSIKSPWRLNFAAMIMVGVPFRDVMNYTAELWTQQKQ